VYKRQNGATYHVAPDVFSELGAEVIAMGNVPDGININEDCGATHVDGLCEAVLRYRADVGVALDGDGDRLIMVDHRGQTVDGDEVLAIIAHHRHKEGKLDGGVVGTLMSNLGLEKSIQSLDVPFFRAKVGDRYVIEQMNQHDCQLGGESSGHIIVRNFITTGDGIIAALQVLRAMRATDKPLHELKKVMTKYPQTLINVPTRHKINLDESAPIQDAVRQVEQQLGNRGRVLLRASGTEPLIRVMVEGEDTHETAALAEDIASAVRAAA
jgi:phosphoglucosamine mutase